MRAASTNQLLRSEWFGGSLDPQDVATETSDAIRLTHHWGGAGLGGPPILEGQQTHFAIRWSGDYTCQFPSVCYTISLTPAAVCRRI